LGVAAQIAHNLAVRDDADKLIVDGAIPASSPGVGSSAGNAQSGSAFGLKDYFYFFSPGLRYFLP
jgi:hypothetical protein